MKVKTIKEFIDKETKRLHEVGDVFDCSPERFVEISKAGKYVEAIKDVEAVKPVEEAKPIERKKPTRRKDK